MQITSGHWRRIQNARCKQLLCFGCPLVIGLETDANPGVNKATENTPPYGLAVQFLVAPAYKIVLPTTNNTQHVWFTSCS